MAPPTTVIRIASSVPEAAMEQIEDLLDAHGVRYRIAEEQLEDPTANHIGAFRRTDSTTSRKAAVGVFPRSGTQRGRVLRALRDAGEYGATSAEIEAATAIIYRSLTPRIGELKAGGWIVSTGRTRTGNMGAEQEVLVLTEKAHAWFSRGEDV